jgi:hypothetical protein
MDLESFAALDEEITKQDWAQTPAKVRRLLRWLLENFEMRLIELEDDKIISRIESETSPKQDMLNQSGELQSQSEDLESEDTVRCSFCGKLSKDVARMIAGPSVHICNECIEICNAILTDDLASQ